MRVLCVFPRYNYGDPARGEGIEYCAFPPAFRNLGHEVIHFDPWDRTHASFADVNRNLLEAVRRSRPDIVFTVQRDYELWSETLAMIRGHYGATCITWTTDDNWKYDEVSRHIAGSYDAIATTYAQTHARYLEHGFPHCVLTQWGANRHWLREPKPGVECGHKVTFIGAAHGGRKAQIAALRKAGIAVECFGHGWDNGPLPAEAIAPLVNDSYISLNFADNYSRRKGDSKQIKARTFEVPGAGGLLCTEYAPGLDEFYGNLREIAWWHSLEECAGLIRFFLANPEARDRIARAGYERTLASHLYDERLARLLERVGPARPGSGDAPPAEWDRIARAHETRTRRPAVRLVRLLLLTVTRSIWGQSQSVSKARTVCFAVSRRLHPRQTFSSAGWPGILLPMA